MSAPRRAEGERLEREGGAAVPATQVWPVAMKDAKATPLTATSRSMLSVPKEKDARQLEGELLDRERDGDGPKTTMGALPPSSAV